MSATLFGVTQYLLCFFLEWDSFSKWLALPIDKENSLASRIFWKRKMDFHSITSVKTYAKWILTELLINICCLSCQLCKLCPGWLLLNILLPNMLLAVNLLFKILLPLLLFFLMVYCIVIGYSCLVILNSFCYRYLLRRSALELFMVDRSNFFFDFGVFSFWNFLFYF